MDIIDKAFSRHKNGLFFKKIASKEASHVFFDIFSILKLLTALRHCEQKTEQKIFNVNE